MNTLPARFHHLLKKMDLRQITILFSSLTAVFLVQQPWLPALVKYSPIIGLIGQPAWLIETYQKEQQGMFIVSIGFTGIYMLGVYTHWIV